MLPVFGSDEGPGGALWTSWLLCLLQEVIAIAVPAQSATPTTRDRTRQGSSRMPDVVANAVPQDLAQHQGRRWRRSPAWTGGLERQLIPLHDSPLTGNSNDAR